MSDYRIEGFARRLRSDPYFLASALEDYAHSEGLDGAGLAAALGCPREELGALGLCRRPRSEPETFADDVRRIAGRFGLSEDRLAEVVRRSDALLAMREAEAEDVIAAARDRIAAEAPPDDELS
jgi:hypothetical protein